MSASDAAWENARNLGWTKDPFELFQKKRYNAKIELHRRLQRWALRSAECLTVSKFLKSVLLKWKIPRKQITVVYNAVHQLKLPSKTALRKKLDFDNKFVLVNVGRVTVYKGVDKIIRMCSKLKIPNLLLVIVGDGPALEDAKKVARAHSLTHAIRFVGRKNKKEVREFMKASDALILNSEYEGMSHTLLDAMSVKCPVIASAVCGNPELVEGRGLLFRYNNMENTAETDHCRV